MDNNDKMAAECANLANEMLATICELVRDHGTMPQVAFTASLMFAVAMYDTMVKPEALSKEHFLALAANSFDVRRKNVTNVLRMRKEWTN